MSIKTLNISEYQQIFTVSEHNKYLYGDVATDFKLIKKIINLIPQKYFQMPQKKWLDPCCGRGYFIIYLYNKLFNSLYESFPNPDLRHKHIIENMLFMIELNEEYIPELIRLFGKNANIYNENFLEIERKGFDFIIGNPPYNVGGIVKVPMKANLDKKGDGRAIWMNFVIKAIECLKKEGYLAFITPSIWMKADHPMYKFMLQYHSHKVHTLTNTETNKIFHGRAQTPTSYFTLVKTQSTNHLPNSKKLLLYDKDVEAYIRFNIMSSIPVYGASVIQKLQKYVIKFGAIIAKKTNMPHPSIEFSPNETKLYRYKNVKTCILKEKIKPHLVINYSHKECVFYKIPKLILAHKMYGFPYYDISGNYGISNRDTFVISNKSHRSFKILKAFLSTKLALYLFEATRYRMKYLEKYIFDMIPDISNDMNVISEKINDEWLSNYFMFDEIERKAIENLHRKNYLSFP